jgi:hypothetical protein
MRNPGVLLVLLLSLSVAACAGDSDNGDPGGGSGLGGGDGTGGGGGGDGTGGGAGGGAGECLLLADYGDAGEVIVNEGGGAVLGDINGATVIQLLVSFSPPEVATPNVLMLQFFEQQGVFAGGYQIGEYALDGAETDLATCGVCARFFGGLDFVALTAQEEYLASAGVVSLQAISATPDIGRVTGSMTDMVFRQVQIDPQTGATIDVPGGCTSKVGQMTFDVPVVALPPAGA